MTRVEKHFYELYKCLCWGEDEVHKLRAKFVAAGKFDHKSVKLVTGIAIDAGRAARKLRKSLAKRRRR